VRHPDGLLDPFINGVDVGAEQATGQEMQGRVLGTGLTRRQYVVAPQAFIDVRASPGALEKIADHLRSREDAVQGAAPAGPAQQRVHTRHGERAAGRTPQRASGVQAGRTHESERTKRVRRLDGRARQKLARQGQRERVDGARCDARADPIDGTVHGIGHEPRGVRPVGPRGETVARQIERDDCARRPIMLVHGPHLGR